MDSPGSGSSTVDALWSAVREKPRDLKPRRALAAELTRLGDPLGELITAGLATHDLSDPATREPLEARVRALHEAAKPRGFPKPPWSGGELGFGHVVDHGVPDTFEHSGDDLDALVRATWWLGHFPLRELRLSFCDPAPLLGQLAREGQLAKIEVLSLNQCPLGPAAIEALAAAAPGLAVLRLDMPRAEAPALAALFATRGMQKVERITINTADLDAAAVHALFALPALTSLCLYATHVAPAADLALSPSPKRALRTLEVQGGYTERQVAQLLKLVDGAALEELSLNGLELTGWLVRGLAAAATMGQLQALRSLELRSDRLDDAAMTALVLTQLPALRALRLDHNKIGPDGLKTLLGWHGLKQVRELWFGRNELWSEQLVDAIETPDGPVGGYRVPMGANELRTKFAIPASIALTMI